MHEVGLSCVCYKKISRSLTSEKLQIEIPLWSWEQFNSLFLLLYISVSVSSCKCCIRWGWAVIRSERRHGWDNYSNTLHQISQVENPGCVFTFLTASAGQTHSVGMKEVWWWYAETNCGSLLLEGTSSHYRAYSGYYCNKELVILLLSRPRFNTVLITSSGLNSLCGSSLLSSLLWLVCDLNSVATITPLQR